MNPLAPVSVALAHVKQRVTRAILLNRICALNPTLQCDSTVIWNYPYRRTDAVALGRGVRVMPFCEILVSPTSHFSSQAGRLIIEDEALITTGVNLRAAGGTIRIGANSAIGQHSAVIAANHQAILGQPYLKIPWDESKVGVDVGRNVWVGANCVLLPGIRIGDNALIAAGSVVNRDVPAGEIWGGVPARFIKAVPGPADSRTPAAALSASAAP